MRYILCGDLALPVVEPIDLASAQLPLVAERIGKLGLGEAWRESATNELQAGLRSFGTAGCLGRRVLLEKCNGQDAIGARLGSHEGCSCARVWWWWQVIRSSAAWLMGRACEKFVRRIAGPGVGLYPTVVCDQAGPRPRRSAVGGRRTYGESGRERELDGGERGVCRTGHWAAAAWTGKARECQTTRLLVVPLQTRRQRNVGQ